MTTIPRFIMIGGFLGAGKTTTIARLAREFQAEGKNVAIVTNDQATDLVDTLLLRSQGFEVGEVAGSCFCCNFNELTRTVERLGESRRPEIVLAEPVGSCTDLVATVIRPLQQIYEQPFEIAPYGVILKPSHGERILKRLAKGGFSPQAEYIFRKQLEEADFAIVNRIDELSPEKAEELTALLHEQFPGREVISLSAKNGEGFAQLRAVLDRRGTFGRRLMEVDYDIYAAGEAELGWLNAQAIVTSREPFEVDRLLLNVIARLHSDFLKASAETAHLKAIAMWEGCYAVANLVSNEGEPVLSLPSKGKSTSLNLVVNARVAIDPESLTLAVRAAVEDESQRLGAEARIDSLQSFRPGRPVPTHRILA